MRYLSYLLDNNRRYGILEGDAVYEIRSPEPDLDGYILKGDLQTASEIKASSKPVPVSEVSLLSPFTRDMNMLCVGLNYWSHADEFSRSMQTSVQNDESIYFTEYRSRSGIADAIGRCSKGQRRAQDLVTGTESADDAPKMKGVRAVGDSDSIFSAKHLRALQECVY